MVLVHRHNIRKRAQYLGNYGAGIGKVYSRGGKRLRKKNKLLESFGSKILNGLLDAGKNLYDNNKDSINKALKEKAGNIVNNLVEKAKDSDMVPDFAKKKLIDNSDLISNVSKKYIDQMINKGSKMADMGVDMAMNKAKSYDPALQRTSNVSNVPYIKRDTPTLVAPTSTNLISGTSSTDIPTTSSNYGTSTNKMPVSYGYGYKKPRRGKGLNIL